MRRFQDVFSDYNINERLAILGYGTKEAYLESKTTIATKARDMVAHYVNHVFSNGYKAQNRRHIPRGRGPIQGAGGTKP